MRCAVAPFTQRLHHHYSSSFPPHPHRLTPLLSRSQSATKHYNIKRCGDLQLVSSTSPMAAPVSKQDGAAASKASAPYPLILLPLRQTKTIHFIRHGEGFHNVAGHANHDNYKSEKWFDAHLTAEGWRQADDLNRHIVASGLQVELVVVSPLMRALETAVGAFGRKLAQPPAAELMVAQAGVPDHSVGRPGVSVEGAPPFIAHELCREIYGVHPCDRRQPTSTYRRLFPGIDWSLITDEQDMRWSKVRESKQSVVERGREFLKFIMQRPESSIAVVTHSTLLHYLLNSFGREYAPPVQDELHRWFENCEMRSVVVANVMEALPADKHHFHGGPLQ